MLEHRFAIGLAFLTFCLLLLGGLVHNTGSSLACPDWPLCYGSVMPKMEGGVAIEHTHRLVAATVGLLTVILSGLIWKRRRGDKKLRWMGIGAVLLVVFQGILGGITVLYKLPTLVSTAHLAVSMLFFSLVVVMAWRTSPPTPLLIKERGAGGEVWVRLATVVVYLQSLLGALVRHTGSGIVCPDIPFCHGALLSVAGDPMQILHMSHRWGGLLTALFVSAIPFLLRKRMGEERPVYFLALLAPLLVLAQVGLGLLSIVTVLGVPAVTAHLGVAALLLGTLVSLGVLV